MTMMLQSSRDDGKINCSGVVIACTGNKHTGYHVSMVFTSLSRQAQARLLAYLASLVDHYPPFRLETSPTSPELPAS